jgi:nucleoside-diphosphate-sugar epimerase
MERIIIPGAAGLVGQNLIIQLKRAGYDDIIAIDKHPTNTKILKKLHPDITVLESDLVTDAGWTEYLSSDSILIMLQAQIGSIDAEDFQKNNIISTEKVIEAAKQAGLKYIIHISSSVVESVADDQYTETKKKQEAMVVDSGIPYCILRPTLMFGWFDRKHLGWLSRFMSKSPVFPIPGSGKYMRQPLYALDFCRIIVSAMQKRPDNKIYNITGREEVDYIDIIREIKKVTGSRTLILKIPYWLFWILLRIYAIFDRDPPFTVEQLKALTAGDEFELIPWWEIFDVEPTEFRQAIFDTFNNPEYSKIILEF